MSNKIGGEHGCFGTPGMPRATHVGEESGKLFYCGLSRSKGYPVFFCSCLCVFIPHERHTLYS